MNSTMMGTPLAVAYIAPDNIAPLLTLPALKVIGIFHVNFL